MMVRTQVSLSAEQHRAAKRRAAELGVSLAELVRIAVARVLGEEVVEAGDREALVGVFDSGGSDIACHKDDYLGEAVEQLRREKGLGGEGGARAA